MSDPLNKKEILRLAADAHGGHLEVDQSRYGGALVSLVLPGSDPSALTAPVPAYRPQRRQPPDRTGASQGETG